MKKKLTHEEAGKIGGLISAKINRKKKKENIKKYLANPKLCQECKSIIPYNKRRSIFCTHSCAATFSNVRREFKRRICPWCKNEITNPKYCSQQCQHNFEWEQTKKLIASGQANVQDKIIKKYLLDVYGNKCMICSITEWIGQPVPLVMDHIDGNPEDSSLANLRIICHNCNALTPTFAGKNRGKGRHYRRQRYAEGKSY